MRHYSNDAGRSKNALCQKAIPLGLCASCCIWISADGFGGWAVSTGRIGYLPDRAVDSKVANISTRGLVQTGHNVLIAGTIILGQTPQRVIIRAIGPSLSVPGKLADLTLELRDSNGGLIGANDNWVDSPNKQAIIDNTIPPSNDLESAIVQILAGNGAQYTAILRGVNDRTGIAVVEVYALDSQKRFTDRSPADSLDLRRVSLGVI